MLILIVLLSVSTLLIGYLWYRDHTSLGEEAKNLRHQLDAAHAHREQLLKQLEDVANELADKKLGKDGDLFEEAVSALVGLGVPGLILLAAIAASGFYGAAAITTALSMLGGPGGMIAGVGVLIAIGLVSKALAAHSFKKLAPAVVSGLLKSGLTKEELRRKIEALPKLAIPKAIKTRALEAIELAP